MNIFLILWKKKRRVGKKKNTFQCVYIQINFFFFFKHSRFHLQRYCFCKETLHSRTKHLFLPIKCSALSQNICTLLQNYCAAPRNFAFWHKTFVFFCKSFIRKVSHGNTKVFWENVWIRMSKGLINTLMQLPH